MKRWVGAACLLLASTTIYAYDCETSYAPSWCANMMHTWNEGGTDAYLPVWIWHNRSEYDSNNVKHYNELPLGAGIGKHFYDAQGDLHRFYGMVFLDSHDDPEPLVGYSFQKIFRPGEDWKFGLGYTAFITARSDIGSYIPFPAALPVWSVSYGRFSIEQTYVPGSYNNGNVLFTWLRFEI